MANHFDRIIKENINALFSFFAKRQGIEVYKTEDLKDKLQITLEREADFLRRILHQDSTKDFILHFEFQSDEELKIDSRLLLYRAILYHKIGLPIKQFVIYLGSRPSKMPTKIEQENLSFRYTIINFCTIDYEELLESDSPEAIIMAILADFKNQSPSVIVEKVILKLTQAVENRLLLSKYIIQLQVLSNLRNLQSEINQNIKNMSRFPDIDLTKDPLFKDAFAKIEKEVLEKGLEKGLEQSILRLLKSKTLTSFQIAEIMEVPLSLVQKLEKELEQPPKNGKKKK